MAVLQSRLKLGYNQLKNWLSGLVKHRVGDCLQVILMTVLPSAEDLASKDKVELTTR